MLPGGSEDRTLPHGAPTSAPSALATALVPQERLWPNTLACELLGRIDGR